MKLPWQKKKRQRDMSLIAEPDIEVTEEMMRQWEEEEYPPADPKDLIIREEFSKPMGRPPLYDEDLVSVTFRAPESDIQQVKAQASSEGISFSEAMRQILKLGMEARKKTA